MHTKFHSSTLFMTSAVVHFKVHHVLQARKSLNQNSHLSKHVCRELFIFSPAFFLPGRKKSFLPSHERTNITIGRKMSSLARISIELSSQGLICSRNTEPHAKKKKLVKKCKFYGSLVVIFWL